MAIAIPAAYQGLVQQAANETGLPVSVVAAQINLESGWNPKAVSSAGAQGIAQFMPGTWAQYGTGSPFDPVAAFRAYSRYMKELLRIEGGNIQKALAAYNAGPGNIRAGMGYANSILRAAGQSSSSSAGPGTTSSAPSSGSGSASGGSTAASNAGLLGVSLGGVQDLALKVLGVTLGLALLGAGVVLTFRKQIASAGRAGASVAGAVLP